MFKDFKVGQYINLESRVHALDPRTKLWVLALFSILVVLAADWVSIVGEFLILLAITFLTRIPWYYYGKSIISLWPVFVFALVLNGLTFNTDGIPKLWLDFSYDGFVFGLLMVTRLCLLILLTAIFSFTTSPITLADALETMFKPLKKIG